ncbi:hypothetical protein M8494_37970 [Serratia ureilytica]
MIAAWQAQTDELGKHYPRYSCSNKGAAMLLQPAPHGQVWANSFCRTRPNAKIACTRIFGTRLPAAAGLCAARWPPANASW